MEVYRQFICQIILLPLDYITTEHFNNSSIAVAMLLSDLDDLRCVLCRSPFLTPQNLPHLLPCTHYICTHCMKNSNQSTFVCPQDLEINAVKDIRSNCPARRALQRLVKQHTTFNQNNQLFCIQSLSKHFQSVLESRSQQKQDFKGLVERIIHNQINRLKIIHQSILQELETPLKMVKEWKEMVRDYLSQVKNMDRNSKKQEITQQLNYFVEQGRRIKSDLNKFQQLDFNSISNIIAVNPTVCLRNEFSLQKYIEIHDKNKEPRETGLGECNESAEDDKESLSVNSKLRNIKQSNIQKIQNSRASEEAKDSRKSKQYQENIIKKDYKIHQSREKLYSQYSIVVSDKNPLNQIQNHIKQSKGSLQPLRQSSRHDPNFNNQSLAYDNKLLVYSLSPSKHEEQSNQMNSDEILLTEKEERREQEYKQKKADQQRFDFLQPWEITQSLSSHSIVVQKRTAFDWEKERNSYIIRLQHSKVQEAVSETTYNQNCIELINYSVSDMDLGLYLKQWPKQRLQVIKLVKTGLSDQQLNEVLNFILQTKVSTLVLCGNSLGQISLDALLNYSKVASNLRNVYLSKNQINPLKGQTRQKISLLRQNGLNLYI